MGRNLYIIIGGSVFPTIPTFTLIALTFRLADYLRRPQCARRCWKEEAKVFGTLPGLPRPLGRRPEIL